MKIFYRISDNSYEKQKLPGTSKETCLMNFVQAFADVIFPEGPETKNPPIRIIADNCSRKTNKMLQQSGLPMTITSLGNAGSFRHALDLALEENDDEVIYFVEDDYLHLPKAPKLIEEGIKRCDYLTLYDHPDKYTRYYEGGETSKVIKTESSHWRYTASTCMTFASTVKTLKEDQEVWKKHTEGDHPYDHQIFSELDNRRLAVCIPGAACHTDLAFSGIVKHVLIESWAIDLMTQKLENDLENSEIEIPYKQMIGDRKGWEKLTFLDAMTYHQNLHQN